MAKHVKNMTEGEKCKRHKKKQACTREKNYGEASLRVTVVYMAYKFFSWEDKGCRRPDE